MILSIVNQNPPNIEEIKKRFSVGKATLFCHGSTLFNPDAVHVPDHVFIHEQTHSKQQGDDPVKWWNKYLTDNDFLLSQEVEAYKAQYKYLCDKIKDRNHRNRILLQLAAQLASPMYGSLISINKACQNIKANG